MALERILVPFDISNGGSFRDSESRQEAIDSAKQIAAQTNYSTNLDKVISAAQSFSKNTNETNLAELGEGITASLNQAKGLREEASVAENRVKTLSKDISSSQGKSVTINKDLTQEVLEFIAHQPTNNGPSQGPGSQIGYERARHIMEQGGEERAAYLQRFQDTHPQYAIQSVDSQKGYPAGGSEALLDSYRDESSKLRNQENVETFTKENIAKVQAQANKSMSDLKPPLSEPRETNPKKPVPTIEQEVSDFLKNADTRLKARQEELEKKDNELQEAKKQAFERPLKGSLDEPVS